MAAIYQENDQVIVRFEPGIDDAVFRRVRGWVYWQEIRVTCARDQEGPWQLEGLELVAPVWAYETVREILSGRLRPELARHEGPGSRVYRKQNEPVAAALDAS